MKQTIIITESLEQQGWNKNKELCMDVNTYLRSDRRMKAGKSYQGVLRRDVEHYASCVANELLWALEGLVEN
jgi:hypothetical protein